MDFRSKALSNPHKLEEMDSELLWSVNFCLNLVLNDDCLTVGTKFVALVIPSSPGAVFDLTSNQYMAGIVTAFIRENSKCPFWQ